MTMIERSEMAIPNESWSWVGFIWSSGCWTLFALGTVAAIFSIVFQVQWILPCNWLVFVMPVVLLGPLADHGGCRGLLISVLGGFSSKQFVESVAHDLGTVVVRFGYQLLGRRMYYITVPLEKIQEVHWNPSQNSEFWIVSVWYDHNDPKKSLERSTIKKWQNPDQDIYCVGPGMFKKETEAFGLAFVDFLLRSGAKLVQKDEHTFVRAINNVSST